MTVSIQLVGEQGTFHPIPGVPWPNNYNLFKCTTQFQVHGNPGPGFLVQHVERNEKIFEPGGLIRQRKKVIAVNDYWERWNVDAGGNVTPVLLNFNDRYQIGGSRYDLTTARGTLHIQSKQGTAGVWKIRGTLYWLDVRVKPAGWRLGAVLEAGKLLFSRYTRPQALGNALLVRKWAGQWDNTVDSRTSLYGKVNRTRNFPSAHFRNVIGFVE